jgi:hypothetical protein
VYTKNDVNYFRDEMSKAAEEFQRERRDNEDLVPPTD